MAELSVEEGDPRNGRAHGHRRLHLRPSAGPARSATDAVLQYRLFVLLPLEPPLDRAHEPRYAGAHLQARVREPAARPAARGGVAWRCTPGGPARLVRGRD